MTDKWKDSWGSKGLQYSSVPYTIPGTEPSGLSRTGLWLTDEEKERYADNGTLRTFPGGATRDTAEGKPVPWRYGSAVTDKLFGEYMLKHQVQSDGEIRDGDNWKSGFGIAVLDDSLSRHVQDYRLIQEGNSHLAREQDVIEVLCAILFNVQALIKEHYEELHRED